MAYSFTSLNLQFHVRSVSLPTRLHPHPTKIEAELNKLKAWEMSLKPTVPPSSETIRIGLVGLAELYSCVEELLHSQQALLQHQHDQILVEAALEESVKLLDACSSVKDIYLTMKEHLKDLQSALRRYAGDMISIESNINAYMCCKKKAKKQTLKCLRSLKQIQNKNSVSSSSHPLDTNHCLSMLIRVVREVTSVTVSVLRSLLLFLSVPSAKTKAVNGWSLISKLMLTKPPAASHEIFNEVVSVDGALRCLYACIRRDVDAKVDVKMASLRRLQTLDASIEGLEAGLDCLFRRLIQNRVFLLNILAQ